MTPGKISSIRVEMASASSVIVVDEAPALVPSIIMSYASSSSVVSSSLLLLSLLLPWVNDWPVLALLTELKSSKLSPSCAEPLGCELPPCDRSDVDVEAVLSDPDSSVANASNMLVPRSIRIGVTTLDSALVLFGLFVFIDFDLDVGTNRFVGVCGYCTRYPRPCCFQYKSYGRVSRRCTDCVRTYTGDRLQFDRNLPSCGCRLASALLVDTFGLDPCCCHLSNLSRTNEVRHLVLN